MINLPHKEPIRFAQSVLSKTLTKVEVMCQFKSIPTLSIFLEAAAQSASALNPKEIEVIAFITSCKKITQVKKSKEKQYLFTVQEQLSLLNHKHYFFKAMHLYDKEELIVEGEFTLFFPTSDTQ